MTFGWFARPVDDSTTRTSCAFDRTCSLSLTLEFPYHVNIKQIKWICSLKWQKHHTNVYAYRSFILLQNSNTSLKVNHSNVMMKLYIRYSSRITKIIVRDRLEKKSYKRKSFRINATWCDFLTTRQFVSSMIAGKWRICISSNSHLLFFLYSFFLGGRDPKRAGVSYSARVRSIFRANRTRELATSPVLSFRRLPLFQFFVRDPRCVPISRGHNFSRPFDRRGTSVSRF